MLKKTGIYLLLLLVWQQSHAYRDVPVLTHLNTGEQRDTFGFNLADALPDFVYVLIEKNLVKLWDSPEQSIAISFESLKTIEKSTETQFTGITDLFMNEVWSSNRKRTQFNILGFSFINKNKNGDAVSYGFVRFDDLQNFLTDSLVPTNANGPAGINYYDALYSRNYHFNVVQFGRNNFKKDILEAVRVKQKAFNKKKKIINLVALPTQKRVAYEIIKSGKSLMFYKGIEGFLNENKEFFFNHGGNQFFNHFNSRDIYLSVSKILVEEVWDKTGSSITYKPASVRVYFGDFSLQPIPLDDFLKYRLKVDFQDLNSALRTKGFDYLLTKINQQDIPPAQSGKYIRALENYFWTQITEYVKYD